MKRMIVASNDFEDNPRGDGYVLSLNLNCYVVRVNADKEAVDDNSEEAVGWVCCYSLGDNDTYVVYPKENNQFTSKWNDASIVVYSSREEADTASLQSASFALDFLVYKNYL